MAAKSPDNDVQAEQVPTNESNSVENVDVVLPADNEEDCSLQEIEITAEVVRRSSVASTNTVIKSGILVKQGGRHKTWKRRMFKLMRNSIVYSDPATAVIKGGILLEMVTCVRGTIRANECRKPNAIAVETTMGRTYYFSATSANDATEWIDAINGVVKKLKSINARETVEEAQSVSSPSQPETMPGADFEADNEIVLHYWPLDGRIHHLKLFLEDCEHAYTHEADATSFFYAGGNTGFSAMAAPALCHKGQTIGQTSVIATYLCDFIGCGLPSEGICRTQCLQVSHPHVTLVSR